MAMGVVGVINDTHGIEGIVEQNENQIPLDKRPPQALGSASGEFERSIAVGSLEAVTGHYEKQRHMEHEDELVQRQRQSAMAYDHQDDADTLGYGNILVSYSRLVASGLCM